MKRILILVTLLLMVNIWPAAAQDGIFVSCSDGQVIENGVEFIVNMRPGFTYTATAIGIDGFDPVLAVLDDSGTSLCNDDDSAAASYSADLPSTGFVPESSLSSQMPFYHNFDGLADISVVVGGFGNTSGEFIVVVEGMAVTSADGSGEGSGDPFAIHVTPNVTASGVPITAYMISVTTGLDPLMKVMNENNEIVELDDGSWLACDDAGQADLCWGDSSSLIGSYISRTSNRKLGGGELDAMMVFPVEELGLGPDEDAYINWNMSSSGNGSTGDYIVVFHAGTGEGINDSGLVADDGALHQWAASVTGTSQYGTDSWSFGQAAGAPDTTTCGDITTAWASESSTGDDVLTLTFAEAVIPAQINIYQTYNPGAIYQVEVAGPESRKPITLPNSDDPPGNTACPGVFSIDVDDVTTPVNQVIIYLDQTRTGSWNEIDAVELVGAVADE